MARAFPDKTIHLQVKAAYLRTALGQQFVRRCQELASNIVLYDGSIYDLFTQVQYYFSDPSAVVAEAAQFAVYSFFIDLSTLQKKSPLRNIPSMCIRSAAEGIARIEQLEDGVWHYPFDEVGEYVHLSDRSFADQLRDDLKLPACTVVGNAGAPTTNSTNGLN